MLNDAHRNTKENNEKETRVAIVPGSIPKLMKLGFEVLIEKGAEKSQDTLMLNTKKKVQKLNHWMK